MEIYTLIEGAILFYDSFIKEPSQGGIDYKWFRKTATTSCETKMWTIYCADYGYDSNDCNNINSILSGNWKDSFKCGEIQALIMIIGKVGEPRIPIQLIERKRAKQSKEQFTIMN